MFHYNDQVSLTLVSGSGGAGCMSFHRTRTQPRGGPDGGDGGKGGSIFFSVSSKVDDLGHFQKKKRWAALPGQAGSGQLKQGRDGKDLIIPIPVGTIVRDEKQKILMDFNFKKEELFLEGGQGGKGNAFYKSSLNQAPRKFQKGIKGQEQKVCLEFKPLIDVALFGEVNSGKSTFFNQVTKGKSPIGAYPYTTLVPYFGKMILNEARVFLMDIPGLEQGAYKNISRGLAFLRSLERAQILLHFIDVNHEDPLASQKKIEGELASFDKKHSSTLLQKLNQKTRWLVLSRIDEIEENELKTIVKKLKRKNQKIFLISTHENQGIKELLIAIEKEFKK